MKKILTMTIILVTILLVSMPQLNSQPSDWIRLTTYSDGDGYPDYSPDGERIAFQRSRIDHWTRDIWIMDADGSNEELLVMDPYGGGVGYPHWSPDGTKIVHDEYHNIYRRDIWFIDVNSKDTTPVVTNFGSSSLPRWSPDGSKILFVHMDVPYRVYNLWTVNIDGTDLNQITYGENHYVWPDWSPDGAKIVVQQSLNGNRDIFLMDADGCWRSGCLAVQNWCT